MLFSKIIKKNFDAVLGRYDGNPAQLYFSPSHFPDLKVESCDIKGDRDILLKGYFYYYGEMNCDRLVVFDHGIGAGHLAYIMEIEMLAKNGFTVYSYDHTGCCLTGGTGILGFAQGINDLDHVLGFLSCDERFKGKGIRLAGHSWGAYSAMNVSALHSEVTHVVSLAGFLSASALDAQYIPKMFIRYLPEVMERERKINPKYADMDARESLLKSSCKLLHLQSKDDIKVKFELCTPLLQEALKDRENTRFIVEEGKNHDPQRTEKAASSNREMLKKMDELMKKKALSNKEEQEKFKASFNWEDIYSQDEAVWDEIIDFLNN